MSKCRKGKHICQFRPDGFCDVNGPASGSTQVMVPNYECVEYGLPTRKPTRHYTNGAVHTPGYDPKSGVDNNEITKLYKKVVPVPGAPGRFRPVFESRKALQEFFSHESVKKAGYVYDR